LQLYQRGKIMITLENSRMLQNHCQKLDKSCNHRLYQISSASLS
jgi:hypothetical protein